VPRDEVERLVLFRAGVFRVVPPVEDFAAVARDFVPEDFARVVVDFLAVVLRADVLRVPVERERPELFAAVAPPVASPPSSVHLPDMTRCAASATASAISEPSFDALATIVLAAA
jgi:hypothetical protein